VNTYSQAPLSATAPPRRIVVSGASRGIGEAIAFRLARPGDELFLLARSEDRLVANCERLRARGAKAEPIAVDLSTVEAASAAADRLHAIASSFDVVILNAGTSNDASFDETTPEEARYELGVNYLAPLTLLHRLLPRMRQLRRGHAICIGSLTSVLPFPGNATYAASKAALLGLVRGLRIEMADDAVHLGIVLPGLTDTDIVPESSSLLPLPRATPESVADAVAECIEERSGVVIPGWSNQMAARLYQSFPDVFDRLLAKTARYLVPGYGPALESEAP